ncbi:MAG TPA: UDP-N-acetylmuramate dehydrogenase, partial [Polyangiaceae bacterium]
EVHQALEWAEQRSLEVRILGGGSNIVVSDAGIEGLALHVAIRGTHFETEAEAVLLRAAAGEPWDALVADAVERNLQGLECLSGIPGFVGATPIQNVGAYGQEVAETISLVRVLDRRSRKIVHLNNDQCRFEYRNSLFKSGDPERYVVLEVTYRLVPGGEPRVRYPELMHHLTERGVSGRPSLAEVRQSVLEVRRSKSMVFDVSDPNHRSCGSFFVNPVVSQSHCDAIESTATDGTMPRYAQADGRVKIPAAWLIERAGFKRGDRFGCAGISSRHSLALVCHQGARAEEVLLLARQIRDRVEQRFGVRLMPEPVFWGFSNLDDGLPVY